MNENIFPPIIQRNEKISLPMRNHFYYPVLKQCLENVQTGRRLESAFGQLGAERIVLYAVNEFSEYICRDLAGSEFVSVCALCDRQADSYSDGYLGLPVWGIDNLYDAYTDGRFDMVVVCNLLYEEEIIKDLLGIGIRGQDVISVSEVVFG